MAVTRYYVNYLIIVRDENDSGYYVLMSTDSSYFAMYAAHVADSSGYISTSDDDLVVNVSSIFPSVTIDGFKSGIVKSLTIY